MIKVLIVEDNEKIAEYTKEFLETNDCVVDIVKDGNFATYRALNHSYDIVVLDIMLPGKDGIEICRELRENKYYKPIIMATALGELDDKINALDSGADDYMVKPYELKELHARIKALVRRPLNIKENVIKYKDLKIDLTSKIVKKNGSEIKLTTKEFQLLTYLLENKGMVLSKEQILEHCWDFAFESFSNIVEAHIKQLRKKLNDKNKEYIETIRGFGYKIK